MKDSAFLAEVATRSREAAQTLGERTLAETQQIRLWLWEIIAQTAFNSEEYGESPLSDADDPVARVRAAAVAVRSLVENSGRDAFEFLSHSDPEDLVRQALDSRVLAEAYEQALRDHEEEVRRRAQFERERVAELLRRS